MLALGISWGNVLEFCMMLNERHGDRRSQALHVVQGRCEVHVPYETYVSLQDVRRDVRRAQSEQAVNPCETLNFRSLSSNALQCTLSHSFMSFMLCGAQKCTQCSRWGCSNAEQRGTTLSLTQLAINCFMRSRVPLAFLAAWAHCWLTSNFMLRRTPNAFQSDLSHVSHIQSVCMSRVAHTQVHNQALVLVMCYALGA